MSHFQIPSGFQNGVCSCLLAMRLSVNMLIISSNDFVTFTKSVTTRIVHLRYFNEKMQLRSPLTSWGRHHQGVLGAPACLKFVHFKILIKQSLIAGKT